MQKKHQKADSEAVAVQTRENYRANFAQDEDTAK